jgi:hypothetical protein
VALRCCVRDAKCKRVGFDLPSCCGVADWQCSLCKRLFTTWECDAGAVGARSIITAALCKCGVSFNGGIEPQIGVES